MDQESQFVSYNIATLNYSSSIVSPYEFHENNVADASLFEYQLDDAFRHFALQEFPGFDAPKFDWGMTGLDLVWKNRYSPFYLQDCGIGPNDKMMNEEQFINQWNKVCDSIKQKVIEDGVQRQVIKGTQLTKQQITLNLQKEIGLCRTFDLVGYKAFIKAFYKIDDIKNLDVSAELYRTQRKKHFSKMYLRQDLKHQKTVHMVTSRGYDVFCMQECDKDFIKYLKNNLHQYLVVEMPNKLSQICQSIILLKKSKFSGYTLQKIEEERNNFLVQFAQSIKNPADFSKKFSPQTIAFLNQKADEYKDLDIESAVKKIHKQLFWNQDTCYAVVGHLIVFSPHISTKASKNAEQINQIKKSVIKILTYFPQKHFICAGDLNGQFENQQNFETTDKKFIKVNAYPYHNDDITCFKMRTLTQAQRNKALVVNFCKKDYIITDLRINQQAVVMADGATVTKANAVLLPNENHPFDHFIVSASVMMIDRIQSASPLRRKKPVSSPFEGFNSDFPADCNDV